MTMTKADLVETVAEAADVPRKQADEVVQVILESIIIALRRNEKVELRGFGSFRIRQRGERIGRNPKTGEQPRTTQKDPVLQTWEVSQGRAPPTVIGGGRDSLRPMAARVRIGG